MQPVRSADYPAHPKLQDIMALDEDAATPDDDLTFDDVFCAWRSYLGREDIPVLLVRSTDRARKLLMQAFGIADAEPVGIPANSRRALSEAVKRSKGTPRFIEMDANLEFDPQTQGIEGIRLAWSEPVGGMMPPEPLPGVPLFVDFGFTMPKPLPEGPLPGLAVLWGLHLPGPYDGALIAFADNDLYEAAKGLLDEHDDPSLPHAMAQYRRFAGEDGITARQMWLYNEIRLGMEAGAGLPMSKDEHWALPYGLAVRIPDEADAGTFISYVRNELVDLDWLPEIQPMFFVSFQITRDMERTRQTANNLARWIVSPIGPDFVDDEITHAVLGILKAAEYTGVRWYTDPERADWYNNLLIEWYGPNHDAYRKTFPAREVGSALV